MLIDASVPVPKYYQIKEAIRKKIVSGEWKSGDKLPSFRHLSKHFGVTTVTVGNAIAELEKENLVHRLQGQGTFIGETKSEESNEPVSRQQYVGLLMPTSGHMFADLFNNLVNGLAQNHYQALPVDGELKEGMKIQDKERQIIQLLDNDPEMMLIDSKRGIPLKLLLKLQDKIRGFTFFDYYCCDFHFDNANYVMSDYSYGGRIIAEHFLSGPFNKIIFICAQDEVPPNTWMGKLLKSVSSVLKKNGLKPSEHLRILNDYDKDVSAKLITSIKQGYRNILTAGDYRAVIAYRLLKNAGLTIGNDVRVMGYYDTPWSAAMEPQISSVNIRVDKIAKRCVQAVRENWRGKKIMIKPELKIKASSA